MDQYRVQQVANLKARKQQRLEETRQRLAKRAARKPGPKMVNILLRVSQDDRDKANAACLAIEGVSLTAVLRASIKAYAESPESELPYVQVDTSGRFLPQDQEWGEMVRDYVAALPPGSDVLLDELFAMMDVPEIARDRAAEMTLGRVLRRLRFFKTRKVRDGERLNIYVKPLE